MVDDAADEDDIPPRIKQRLDRQLRYFSDISPGTPTASECQAALSEARVAVLGAGGLGGRIALDLAAMGVGSIRLTDGDRLELSNLNRQIQYSEPDIGEPKAELMGARLRAFNSDIHVEATCDRLESKEELATFIEGSTFVIGSADWPPYVIEHWCNAACFELGIPYIAMNQLPPFVRVGPIFVPGQTGCFECEMTRYRREHPLMDEAIDQRRDAEPVAATLSPTSGMIASLVSMEVLHFITGLVPPASLGVGLTLDTRHMTFERDAVVKEPGCPTCGG
jgi:bacteriocin biosynthesis cyclodehydratase domain-containing protein